MALTAFPGLVATRSPAASLSHPAPLATTGRIIYVSSTQAGSANDNVGDNPLRPKATWAGSIARGVANRGDQIWLMPGHRETVRTAGGITMNVEGIDVIGMGIGDTRPVITFESATTASVLLSANSCSVYNVVGTTGIASLSQPFDVTGDDCTLDIEWQDASSALSAARAVLATGVTRLNIALKYRGLRGGSNVVNGIRLNDCSDVEIVLDAYGNNSVAWVEMVGVFSSNVFVSGRAYTDLVTDGSQNVIDTIGGSFWGAELFDMGAGVRMSGGSGSAVAQTYLNKEQLDAVLDAAGLLDVGDEIARLKRSMEQIRFGLTLLTDHDLTALDADPCAAF